MSKCWINFVADGIAARKKQLAEAISTAEFFLSSIAEFEISLEGIEYQNDKEIPLTDLPAIVQAHLAELKARLAVYSIIKADEGKESDHLGYVQTLKENLRIGLAQAMRFDERFSEDPVIRNDAKYMPFALRAIKQSQLDECCMIQEKIFAEAKAQYDAQRAAEAEAEAEKIQGFNGPGTEPADLAKFIKVPLYTKDKITEAMQK